MGNLDGSPDGDGARRAAKARNRRSRSRTWNDKRARWATSPLSYTLLQLTLKFKRRCPLSMRTPAPRAMAARSSLRWHRLLHASCAAVPSEPGHVCAGDNLILLFLLLLLLLLPLLLLSIPLPMRETL